MSFGSPDQSSKSDPVSFQTSTQGGAGAGSQTSATTLQSNNGSFVQNDPTLQIDTVKALADTVQKALAGGGQVLQTVLQNQSDLTSTAAQQSAQSQSDNSGLLYQVLSNEQNLAAAVGTGGKSLDYNTNNYLIWGAVAVAIAAVIGLFAFARGNK